ncbi:hypothetical protein DBR11_20415 [Pedobacter sp. HMWF019]|nr:hypothetical protein DBR11_20415 [Pedobacter sp. HMWF019]
MYGLVSCRQYFDFLKGSSVSDFSKKDLLLPYSAANHVLKLGAKIENLNMCCIWLIVAVCITN